jgi:pimeloyl-ACP methyl ester carboxylesterase
MDPNGAGKTVRAPNGVVLDGKEYWSARKAIFDPAKITAPVLLVVGEWDQDKPTHMAQTLLALLVNAKWRQLTMPSEGAHRPHGEESDAAIPDSATFSRGGSATA